MTKGGFGERGREKTVVQDAWGVLLSIPSKIK
jgi:hypothetical protein